MTRSIVTIDDDNVDRIANLANIPDELKALDQWVSWSNVKVPINARVGTPASVTDPSTWSPYAKAREAVTSGKRIGVGFVFTEKGFLTGIDLDKVINDAGKIEPWAQSIVNQMDSYTEISQSETGLHIIVKGEKPGTDCRKDQVEIYDCKRYFALTGNLLDGAHSTIEARQEQLDVLYAETFGVVSESTKETARPVSDLVLDPDADPPAEKMQALIKKDREFKKTWSHKRSDLPSLSDYDWHLALFAYNRGWSNQEIANLIIAFRRTYGNADDRKKSMRPDYILRTLDKLTSPDSNILAMLPFKVVKVFQYGTEDSTWELVLDDGMRIMMGET